MSFTASVRASALKYELIISDWLCVSEAVCVCQPPFGRSAKWPPGSEWTLR